MTTTEYFGDWLNIIPENVINVYRNFLLKAVTGNVPIEPKDTFGVFKAFNRTSFENCKAIIIGQDPYFDGRATGLAFGNNLEPDEKPSPSLRVIKDSVLSLVDKEEIPKFDYSLESWAKQGILLLNSALTVKRGEPNSHSAAWEPFMKVFIKRMSTRKDVIWLLFGKRAWELSKYITGEPVVLKYYHPAFYARNVIPMPSTPWENLIKYYKENYNIDLQLYD